MRVGYVEDETFNYFRRGAKEGDGTVGGGMCGVFVGFENCDDGAMFPDVGYYVVCVAVFCNVGECLYAMWAKVFEVNVTDVVWPACS